MTGPSPYDDYDRTPLAERYADTQPVEVGGALAYPMYREALGPDPTLVTLTLHATAPPPGLLGLGMGLSVLGGHVVLQGRRLHGVDVWPDAMANGACLEVCAAGPDAWITVTPVWMDAAGATRSWTGNYGVVIDRAENGHPLLRCSGGIGPPDFRELVVEVHTVPAPTDQSRYRTALYDLAVAMHGRGDVEQACALWSQAAGFGHAGAAYDLGVVRFRRGEFSDAERWWRAAADHGDVRAMAGLAEVLERQGNTAEAQRWRAGAAGFPPA
ncbi:tetratricopeptide repeat protein [Nocardia blacklockiae]|uniref:tetratricopeptide repeat protein n=1 Tax=Nocardia blacklockiae TaxID=480036 RepID=UPI00189632CC|nr:tetratricopeptide repeat protein [Nocardia blacklockiae]MBF6170697.1 tetratricopeptide repeat protein [Nocardia blacklockiae]